MDCFNGSTSPNGSSKVGNAKCKEGEYKNQTGNCVPCVKPDYWDAKGSKCLRCPSGFEIDPSTLKCACPKNKPFLAANNTCISCETKFDPKLLDCTICTGGKVWNKDNSTCVCPSGVFTNALGECVNCSKPNYWNAKDLVCLRCPQGF